MFDLPKSSIVKKVIPKNAFDAYTNTKQKKVFSDMVLRITWMNKLSRDTINLIGTDIQEIQIFEIELKEKTNISDVLTIIDKAIPYHIIFVIKHLNENYISTSVKHPHPTNEDNAVIDYIFVSEWKKNTENDFIIEIKNNLEWVYKNFCFQFVNETNKELNLKEFVDLHKDIQTLEKEIKKLKSSISSSKQFSEKVEFNVCLKKLEFKLAKLKK